MITTKSILMIHHIVVLFSLDSLHGPDGPDGPADATEVSADLLRLFHMTEK